MSWSPSKAGVLCRLYLCYQSLVLQQPSLSHGRLPVEAAGHLLQLLLPDELLSQDALSLVLRLLQALPGLTQHTDRKSVV